MSPTNSPPVAGAIISLAAAPKKPWGKGQGEVREIASGRLDTGGALLPGTAQDWDWRLSVASIEKSGAFTPYAGCDRTLTVINGELLELTIDGNTLAVELYRPLKFSGGSQTNAALPTGEVLVLNLITRSGSARGNVRIVELSKKRDQHLFGSQFGVLLQGKASVLREESERVLGVRDTVVGGEEDPPRIGGRGFMAVVSLDLP